MAARCCVATAATACFRASTLRRLHQVCPRALVAARHQSTSSTSHAATSVGSTEQPSGAPAAGGRPERLRSRVGAGGDEAQHTARIDEMIRVDHAGEVGAVRIYEGQMWVLRGTPAYDTLVVR